MLAGQQMLTHQLISSPDSFPALDLQFGGRACFIGYPVEDGSVGSSFMISNRKLAMSAFCRNKEAAWEFIREILLPQYDEKKASWEVDNLHPEAINIPINRADYERMKKDSRKARTAEVFPFGPIADFPPLSDEDYRRFEDLLNSIEKVNMCDINLYLIVYEQAAPYFAGDRTLDEAVDLIQRRVSLYVNETR